MHKSPINAEVGNLGTAGRSETKGVGVANVSSRDGSLRITTDASGRPTEMNIDSTWRGRNGTALAGEILQLCELARLREGVARRTELLADGTPKDVVLSLGLPTPAELALLEARFDYDGEVGSWLGKA